MSKMRSLKEVWVVFADGLPMGVELTEQGAWGLVPKDTRLEVTVERYTRNFAGRGRGGAV